MRSRARPPARFMLAQPPCKADAVAPTQGNARPPLAMTFSQLFRVAALAALASATAAAGAAPACRAESGAQTTALVELYTSEGCDSCPPADRWLSATFAPGHALPGAIALAFHVDYWDRLGWTDRFAAAAWTKRQYDSARAQRSDLVYTPQVLLQGRDADWRNGPRFASAVAAAARSPARAAIALTVAPQADAVAVSVVARVPGPADRRGARVFVALTGDGLASEVKAGENAGKRLVHDHVVRALRDVAIDAAGDGTGTFVLPWPAEAGSPVTVAAFVQNVDNGAVLQALSLPLAAGCVPVR